MAPVAQHWMAPVALPNIGWPRLPNNVNNGWPRLPNNVNNGWPRLPGRILDEGYGKMTDLRPVGAGSSFNNVNNGWPRLPA